MIYDLVTEYLSFTLIPKLILRNTSHDALFSTTSWLVKCWCIRYWFAFLCVCVCGYTPNVNVLLPMFYPFSMVVGKIGGGIGGKKLVMGKIVSVQNFERG